MVASVWSREPSVVVMDLVSAANSGFEAVRSNFEFSTAPSGTDLPQGTTKNTQISLAPTTAGAATYEGTVKVAYDRLSVEAYLDGITTATTFDYTADPDNDKPVLTDALSNADIVKVIRALTGLGITDAEPEFDATAFDWTKNSDTQYHLVLTAIAGSFLFSSSSTGVTINVVVPKQQTSSVVQNTELDGLDAPTNGG